MWGGDIVVKKMMKDCKRGDCVEDCGGGGREKCNVFWCEGVSWLGGGLGGLCYVVDWNSVGGGDWC